MDSLQKTEDNEKEKDAKVPYPKHIFYIISMEACERFSYYGMKSKYKVDMIIFWDSEWSLVNLIRSFRCYNISNFHKWFKSL